MLDFDERQLADTLLPHYPGVGSSGRWRFAKLTLAGGVLRAMRERMSRLRAYSKAPVRLYPGSYADTADFVYERAREMVRKSPLSIDIEKMSINGSFVPNVRIEVRGRGSREEVLEAMGVPYGRDASGAITFEKRPPKSDTPITSLSEMAPYLLEMEPFNWMTRLWEDYRALGSIRNSNEIFYIPFL